VVFTDLEPDDYFALLLMQKLGYDIRAIVVGEGDVSIKYACALQFTQMLGWTNTQVIPGLGSNKYWYRIPIGSDQVDQDGKYMTNLEVVPQSYDDTQFRSFMERFSNTEGKLMILKPMRELMKWYVEAPEHCAKVCSQFEALIYGSFNFRKVFEVSTKEQVANFLCTFKRTHIYESFLATGSQNSMNDVTDPELHKVLSSFTDTFSDTLRAVTKLWNDCIKYDCVDTCQGCLVDPGQQTYVFDELTKRVQLDACANVDVVVQEYFSENRTLFKESTPDNFLRNFKCFYSVTGHETFQYVLADQCSIAAHADVSLHKYAQPCTVSFHPERGFTQTSPCDDSSVYVFKDIPRKEVVDAMLKIMTCDQTTSSGEVCAMEH